MERQNQSTTGDQRRTESSSASSVAHFENGEQVFPCRCGVTHRGEYAAYDYGHHNCFHDAPLLFIESADPNEGDAMCPQCGKTWPMRHAA